jgi:hypothetical protein
LIVGTPLVPTLSARAREAARLVSSVGADPTSADQPGGMDPPKATSVSLAAMAKRPQPLLRQRGLAKFPAAVAAGSPTGFWRMSGHPVVNRPCATRISTASVFPASTFLPKLNPIEPPCYGPVARWCGRGGAARRPPIPINRQYAAPTFFRHLETTARA